MMVEIAFENGRISNSEGFVSVTLSLDRVLMYTIVHHSSTSTNMPNFIGEGHTDGFMDGHLRPALLV